MSVSHGTGCTPSQLSALQPPLGAKSGPRDEDDEDVDDDTVAARLLGHSAVYLEVLCPEFPPHSLFNKQSIVSRKLRFYTPSFPLR